jgi:hypothetical protein
VAAAVATNLILTLAQIVGGIMAGSVALIADAMHNLSDAPALIIAFAAPAFPAPAGPAEGRQRSQPRPSAVVVAGAYSPLTHPS